MEQKKIIYSNLEYDNLLLSLIPQVSKMKYKSGSEGVAYFVDEDYLKQFDSFGRLIIQNKNIAAEALKRFINKINYVVEPVIRSKAEYAVMRYDLKKLFGTQKTEELLSEVQKEF